MWLPLCCRRPATPSPPTTEPAEPAAPGVALRTEVLERQVAALYKAVDDLTRHCVTRDDLASMAGVEEAQLDDVKLRTGGKWNFMAAAVAAADAAAATAAADGRVRAD